MSEAIPDIEFRYPDCPCCDQMLEGDVDSWWCDRCEISWSYNGTGGERHGEPPVLPTVGATITGRLPTPCIGPLLRQETETVWRMQCRKCTSEHVVTPAHHRWTVLPAGEDAA